MFPCLAAAREPWGRFVVLLDRRGTAWYKGHMAETITEMVARMQAQNFRVGTRIRVIGTGRTGTIVKRQHRHTGWAVRWDDPMFGVEVGNVRAVHMERE